jgi:hypothetical protein
MLRRINKGTGAGGAAASNNGKSFESITDNTEHLLNDGFVEKFVQGLRVMVKTFENKSITFVTQGKLKKYMSVVHDKTLHRHPDEAYVVTYSDGTKCLKIIEKKNQSVEGSVIDKLLCASVYKLEYKLALDDEKWDIEYCLCVSDFLKRKINSGNKKYKIWNSIWNQTGVRVFYGEDDDYASQIHEWINQ